MIGAAVELRGSAAAAATSRRAGARLGERLFLAHDLPTTALLSAAARGTFDRDSADFLLVSEARRLRLPRPDESRSVDANALGDKLASASTP